MFEPGLGLGLKVPRTLSVVLVLVLRPVVLVSVLEKRPCLHDCYYVVSDATEYTVFNAHLPQVLMLASCLVGYGVDLSTAVDTFPDGQVSLKSF